MELVRLSAGVSQFRVSETTDKNAECYLLYNQLDMQEDLVGIYADDSNQKRVRTLDKVSLLQEGDVIFSLISGDTTLVSEKHAGCFHTQNYIKLTPIEELDKKFLVYYINEHPKVRKHLQLGLQGSNVIKYTSKQLGDLEIADLPPIDIQRQLGELYFNQLRLRALKERVGFSETAIVLDKLREVHCRERVTI